jgi:hypothetical protein
MTTVVGGTRGDGAGPANFVGTRTARRMSFVPQDEPALRRRREGNEQQSHCRSLAALGMTTSHAQVGRVLVARAAGDWLQ